MTSLASVPDLTGHFGPYGGTFVPETLVAALEQLTAEYEKAKKDSAFQDEFESYLHEYVGRPSRLYFARRLTEAWGGPKVEAPVSWDLSMVPDDAACAGAAPDAYRAFTGGVPR